MSGIAFETAEKIRSEAAAGESQRDLGRRYGISGQSVARILSYETHRPADTRRISVLLIPADAALLEYLALTRKESASGVASDLLSWALANTKIDPPGLHNPSDE